MFIIHLIYLHFGKFNKRQLAKPSRVCTQLTKGILEKDRILQFRKIGLTQTKAKRRQSGVFETLKAK